ncbi:hypothetical protein ACWGIP_17545, partial [Streptomyces sp. NPDC054838]
MRTSVTGAVLVASLSLGFLSVSTGTAHAAASCSGYVSVHGVVGDVSSTIRRRKTTIRSEDVTVSDRPQVRRAVTAAALGNTMEWFDFGVYAYLAGTMGKVFFPDSSPGVQVVSAFATFAAAFLVR